MARLKLRTFSIALVLVSASLGMALQFSDSVLDAGKVTFDEKSEINDLRNDFSSASQNVSSQRSTAQGVDIETDFFFLTGIWNIMKTTVAGVGNVVGFIGAAGKMTGLNIPGSVFSLTSIIVIGVIFAVVSAARGWDV